MLKIQNLSVNYGPRRILHDISLNVQSGEVLALIGPNGAGKSTLIRAVSGVIPSAGGSVRTDENDFASLSPIQRARYIATVFCLGARLILGFLASLRKRMKT
jgi:ABC-type cobalamin/Fe3+-siderophores transport system ATPase subunit